MFGQQIRDSGNCRRDIVRARDALLNADDFIRRVSPNKQVTFKCQTWTTKFGTQPAMLAET
jgi:hypothetical protein